MTESLNRRTTKSTSPARGDQRRVRPATHSQAQFRRVADTMRCSPNPVLTASMFSLLLLEEGSQRAAQVENRRQKNEAFEQRCELAQLRREEHLAAEQSKLEAKMKRHAASQKSLMEQRAELTEEARQRADSHAEAVSKSRSAQQKAHYDRLAQSVTEKDEALDAKMATRRADATTACRNAQSGHDSIRSVLLKRRPSQWHKYIQDFAKNPNHQPSPATHHATLLDSLLFEATAKRPSTAFLDVPSRRHQDRSRIPISERLEREIAAGMDLARLLETAEEDFALEQERLEDEEKAKVARSNAVREEVLQKLQLKRQASHPPGVDDTHDASRRSVQYNSTSPYDASLALNRLASPTPASSELRTSLAAKELLRRQKLEKLEEQRQLDLEDVKSRRASRLVAVETRFDRVRHDTQRRHQSYVDEWRSRVGSISDQRQADAQAALSLMASCDSPIVKDVAMHQHRARVQLEAAELARERKLQDEAQSFVLKLTKNRNM